MPGGRPPSFNPFTCANCGASYQVVKVEAGPETGNREITCQVCGAQLAGREGNFVLKYFLLRKGIPSRRGLSGGKTDIVSETHVALGWVT